MNNGFPIFRRRCLLPLPAAAVLLFSGIMVFRPCFCSAAEEENEGTGKAESSSFVQGVESGDESGRENAAAVPVAVMSLQLPSLLKTSEILAGLGESFLPRSADWIVLGTAALAMHPAFSDFDMTAPFSFCLLSPGDGGEWGLCIFADRKRETLPREISLGGKIFHPLFLPGAGKRVCLLSSRRFVSLFPASSSAGGKTHPPSFFFSEPACSVPPGGVELRFDRRSGGGDRFSWNDALSHLLHSLFPPAKNSLSRPGRKTQAPSPGGEKLLPQEAVAFLNRFDLLEWKFFPDREALSMTLVCRDSASASSGLSSEETGREPSLLSSPPSVSPGGRGEAFFPAGLPARTEFAACLFPGRNRDAILERVLCFLAALRMTGEGIVEDNSASDLSPGFFSFLIRLQSVDQEVLAFAGREEGIPFFGLELSFPEARSGELDSFLLRSGARRTEEPYFWHLRSFGGELPGALYCFSEPGKGKLLFFRSALPLAELAVLRAESGSVEIPREGGFLRLYAIAGGKTEDPPLLEVDSDSSGKRCEFRLRLEKRWMPFWRSLFLSSSHAAAAAAGRKASPSAGR